MMLDAALDYAARGWPVLPCNPSVVRPYTKRPLTTHGFKDATTDAAFITAWWRRWPSALIGVPMGRATAVFAIDPDVVKRPGDADGLAAWQALVEERGGIPHTHSHITPSGGRHYLFRWHEALKITNKEGSLPDGINVRGEGGYVICPPSAMADGRKYQIADEFDFWNFADPPDWLIQLILTDPKKAAPEQRRAAPRQSGTKHERYVAAAVERECTAVASCRSGGRNNQLNASAFSLGTLIGANCLDAALASNPLFDAGQACGLVDDDGDRSVMATIESGLTAGAAKPRTLPDFEARTVKHKRRDHSDEAVSAQAGDNLPLITEDEAALQFAERYAGRLRYCHDHGAWFEWNGVPPGGRMRLAWPSIRRVSSPAVSPRMKTPRSRSWRAKRPLPAPSSASRDRIRLWP